MLVILALRELGQKITSSRPAAMPLEDSQKIIIKFNIVTKEMPKYI